MRWLRRVFGMLEDGWPTRTPPTVPPAFHCPGCKRPVPVDARVCPTCGKELVGTESVLGLAVREEHLVIGFAPRQRALSAEAARDERTELGGHAARRVAGPR